MKRLLSNSYTKSRQYLLVTAIVLLMSAICFGLSDMLGYHVVALILLFTVSLLAVSFDIFPVLLAAVLSAFIWNFFFIPPRFTIHVRSTEDTILLLMYFVIAMISGVLTFKIRQAEKISRLKEERANSVKLYNTILNSLSHELKTPIAAIIAATDNLQSNRNLDDSSKEDLVKEISKAGLRLNQQVENLLNISRLESGHIQPRNDWCDVVELTYDVVKRVEENNYNRKISVSSREDLPLLAIDKGMLDQVMYNLLNNAAIHTEPNKKISISLQYIPTILQIIIEDNGAGFKASGIKNIFEKFSRTGETAHAGPGLGLSIVKGFTEALGGTIDYEELRPGSRFIISIPVKSTYNLAEV